MIFLLSLSHFTQYDTLYVHPCCCKLHYFILFNGWVVHCIYVICGPFINSLLFLFYILFLGHETCGISAPWPRVKSTSPALEGEILIPGSSGKATYSVFSIRIFFLKCKTLPEVILITIQSPQDSKCILLNIFISQISNPFLTWQYLEFLLASLSHFTFVFCFVFCS